jgi:hypothetical protein
MSVEGDPSDKQPSNALQKAATPPTSGAQPFLPPPEFFQQFIKNQADEIAIRGQELAIRQKEIETSHEYAKSALDAQSEDLKDDRRSKKTERRDRLAFGLVALVILAILIIYALYLNKDDIAKEIVKAVAYLTAGAAGGYGAATVRASKQRKDDDE